MKVVSQKNDLEYG
jgi:ABC-type Na+ transport system ATPase subunit NatA